MKKTNILIFLSIFFKTCMPSGASPSSEDSPFSSETFRASMIAAMQSQIEAESPMPTIDIGVQPEDTPQLTLTFPSLPNSPRERSTFRAVAPSTERENHLSPSYTPSPEAMLRAAQLQKQLNDLRDPSATENKCCSFYRNIKGKCCSFYRNIKGLVS